MSRRLHSLAIAALVAGAAITAAHAGEKGHQRHRIVVHGDEAAAHHLADPAQIPGDHLRIDDLADLAVGDSRSYWTESGREVTVTRRDESLYVVVEGREIVLGDELPRLEQIEGIEGFAGIEHETSGEHRRIVIRRSHDAAGPTTSIEEELTLPPRPQAAAGDDAPGAADPVVIEIVDETDGKSTRRIVVLDVAAHAAAE